MVRAMLTVLALGGAAAEENVTTTTIMDGPGMVPENVNNGCWDHEAYFIVKDDPFDLDGKGRCHAVCEQVGPAFRDKHHDGVKALDFTQGGSFASTVMGAISHNSKMKCNGCSHRVCKQHNGHPCYTEAQINAGFVKYEFTHGCVYGSMSNTCAYDGAFGKSGTWDGEVLLNFIMPEETCRYTYFENTYMGDVAAIEHLIQV